MEQIYQHQFIIGQTEEKLMFGNGHFPTAEPYRFEWRTLPLEVPTNYLDFEITSTWSIKLHQSEDGKWQTTVTPTVSAPKAKHLPSLGIHFDKHTSQFYLEGRPLPLNYLTDLEHRLLRYFIQRVGQVCSYPELAKHVWFGWANDNTISQSVYRLRKKLEGFSNYPEKQYIEASRGATRGYMLVAC